MKWLRLLTPLAALLALTVSAFALEPVMRPISNGGYTHYAIDGDGILWSWGDSVHGGITAEVDPVLWEDAVLEVKNAVYAESGFLTGFAVDRDGILWGWGNDFHGKLCGQSGSQGAVRLMDHVVSVCDMTECVVALKDDGTLWIWGGYDAETEEFRMPEQIMDHVRTFWGNYIQLENDTWVERRSAEGGETLELPVAVNTVELCYDDAADALLMLGENGGLYRAVRKGDWYDTPEPLLENVVCFHGGFGSTAVTADGTLWAWGHGRPAILKDGVPDPEDSYDSDLPDKELAAPVKIMEGVRYAEATEDCTLAIMEDGSLWELPSARHVSIQEEYPQERFPEVRTACRKLLDQAAPVRWFEGDPNASAPVVLEMPEELREVLEAEETEPSEEPLGEELGETPDAEEAAPLAAESGPFPWAALAISLLPLAAAGCLRWKKRS